MLYEMLTGHPPFEDDDPFVVASARQIGDPKAPRELDATISVQAEEIVLRALRRDPAERYASAAAIKADLDAPARVVVSGLSGRLVKVTRGRKRSCGWRDSSALTAMAPLALLVAAFLLLLVVVRSNSSAPPSSPPRACDRGLQRRQAAATSLVAGR